MGLSVRVLFCNEGPSLLIEKLVEQQWDFVALDMNGLFIFIFPRSVVKTKLSKKSTSLVKCKRGRKNQLKSCQILLFKKKKNELTKEVPLISKSQITKIITLLFFGHICWRRKSRHFDSFIFKFIHSNLLTTEQKSKSLFFFPVHLDFGEQTTCQLINFLGIYLLIQKKKKKVNE